MRANATGLQSPSTAGVMAASGEIGGSQMGACAVEMGAAPSGTGLQREVGLPVGLGAGVGPAAVPCEGVLVGAPVPEPAPNVVPRNGLAWVRRFGTGRDGAKVAAKPQKPERATIDKVARMVANRPTSGRGRVAAGVVALARRLIAAHFPESSLPEVVRIAVSSSQREPSTRSAAWKRWSLRYLGAHYRMGDMVRAWREMRPGDWKRGRRGRGWAKAS